MLPLKHSFALSNVRIDNLGLMNILQQLGLWEGHHGETSERHMISNKDRYWKEYFNVEKYEISNRKFACIQYP